MSALSSPDAAFAAALAAVATPNVPTHTTFCGERFPRDPQDIARDQWVAQQTPVVVAALRSRDASLAAGFHDVKWTPAILDAFRNRDALEFLRLVENAVDSELANDAELTIEEEAYERFPEGAA